MLLIGGNADSRIPNSEMESRAAFGKLDAVVRHVAGDDDLAPLTFTGVRTSGSTAAIDWGTTPDDAPAGVTILRATGTHTVDGNGHAYGQTGYDPTTIDGATIITTGLTVTPYTDTGLDPATAYTYAIVRTGT